jgi:hypothetical protein
MSVMDERVSRLVAEIHDQPSPEEAFSRWMFVDIFILDGLMMLFTIVFIILRDIIVVLMIGFGSVAFGSAYLYIKDRAKTSLIAGRDFLDSQTLIGDYEITEQIAIKGYDYVILPDQTIDGKKIAYSRVDVDDTLGILRATPIRVGGSSELRPEAVDHLVRLRLRELKEYEVEKRGKAKEIEKAEKARRKAMKKGGISLDIEMDEEKSTIKKLPSMKGGRRVGDYGTFEDEEDMFEDIEFDSVEFDSIDFEEGDDDAETEDQED